MVDFTMCSNQECLLGDYCERQTAARSKRQSFAHFLSESDGEWCDHLMPNEQYKAFLIIAGRERELDPIIRMRMLKNRKGKGLCQIDSFPSFQSIGRALRVTNTGQLQLKILKNSMYGKFGVTQNGNV
jgi:hypothetical protein